MTTARSGRAALAAFVRGNTAILARVAVVDEVARSVPHEPDAADGGRQQRAAQARGVPRRSSRRLADRFGLRAGLTVDTATDLLLMFGPGPASGSIHALPRRAFPSWANCWWLSAARAPPPQVPSAPVSGACGRSTQCRRWKAVNVHVRALTSGSLTQ